MSEDDKEEKIDSDSDKDEQDVLKMGGENPLKEEESIEEDDKGGD